MGTGLSIRSFVTVVVTSTLLSACTAAQHKASVQDDSTDRLTVGRVQKEIHTGMSGAEVAETLARLTLFPPMKKGVRYGSTTKLLPIRSTQKVVAEFLHCF